MQLEDKDDQKLCVLSGMSGAMGALFPTPVLGVLIIHELGNPPKSYMESTLLMSIPAILGAGVLLGKDVLESGDSVLQANVILAAALAFFAALIAIAAMMYWLQRQSYTPFVAYRLLLGVIIVWYAV